MLGATLIESKDDEEEDCSLRKASNRLLLPYSLRRFFYIQPHPPIPAISLEYPQNSGSKNKSSYIPLKYCRLKYKSRFNTVKTRLI
jgi:hypothetical protein